MRSQMSDDPVWLVPCPRYNKGRCEEGTHEVSGVIMQHVCCHCSAAGYDNPHTNRACNKRRNYSGNNPRHSTEEKKENRGNKAYQGKRDMFDDGPKNLSPASHNIQSLDGSLLKDGREGFGGCPD